MRILLALTLFATACGGTQPKKESAIVSEGADSSPSCCCKTVPTTAEKEIIPNYDMRERMECSSAKGDCVDEVQCAGKEGATTQESGQPSGTGADGVPPPPVLEPSTTTP
jgi:hypothetical protein